MNKETAELIVDKIIDDLNGRRGCGIDSLDGDIQEEIKATKKEPKTEEAKA
jgi:hypothetical protein